MMRAAVKDKSYRATPVGLLVGRYLRWFRNEWGATATTIRDYEAILARMSLSLADKDPLEVTVDDLRDVIDLWADREARTRAKVTSVVRAFWSWAENRIRSPSPLRRSSGVRGRRGGRLRSCRRAPTHGCSTPLRRRGIGSRSCCCSTSESAAAS